VSPLTLRRYRAERLLRQEFDRLRGRVLAMVGGRLGARGLNLATADLEACYAQAWQGLYTAMLEGAEIANPIGWLALVTFRRAIEEQRARSHEHHGDGESAISGYGAGATLATGPSQPGRRRSIGGRGVHDALERDFAGELDDRARLRQLFEGLRGHLSTRECQAAALCYLQGLSRAEAAARMGISESRMRKLMEGQGGGSPGVASKVGQLLDTIRGGGWCEEQSSLMRGLAFGILDPNGERYQLALAHRRSCPACRAYVLSLRGLAAVLPPVVLPLGLGAGAGAAVGAGVGAGNGAGVGGGAGVGSGAGVGGAGAPVTGAGIGAGAQTGAGVGALSASGAAGVGGAAGGSWLLAGGPIGAKLAVGCLLALSVGAGCMALTTAAPRVHVARRHAHHVTARGLDHGGLARGLQADAVAGSLVRALAGAPLARLSSPLRLHAQRSGEVAQTSALRASREFGPEQASASPVAARGDGSTVDLSASTAQRAPAGRAASEASSAYTHTPAPGTSVSSAGPRSSASGGGRARSGVSAAQREFGLG
jgi:DNA-directed RNA polymerase specialized sigma24 family protein